MTSVEFTRQIEAANRRMAALSARAAALPSEETLNEALEELGTAMEELRVAEEQLRLQNQQLAIANYMAEKRRKRYEDFFQSAPDAYLVTDEHGTIREANRAASRLLNVPAKHLVGKPMTVYVAPKDQTFFHTQLIHLLKHRRAKEWTVCLLPRSSGAPKPEVYVAVTVAMVGGENDEPDSLRWLLRDVTGRWHAEEEIRLMNAELERRVRERTRDLEAVIVQRDNHETELERRAEALAESDRRKDEFLATLAHELRTPLASLRNAFHILSMRGHEKGIRDWSQGILDRQIQYLANLVDDLLDISGISQGKTQLHCEPVDVAAVGTRCAEMARPLLEERRHRLALNLPEQPTAVFADPTRMQQIVSNLLNNAIKYTEPGGDISLSVESAGEEVVIRVRDSGIGIAPEVLPKVFDLFVQANPGLEHNQGGLGIGLTLVRRLVEMHGGSVAAYSEGRGRGSEFLVRFPALNGQAVDLVGKSSEQGKPNSAPALRVLVVEDNRDAAESLGVLLKMWGHEVSMAYDGKSALETARGHKPEVVLLDIGLPDMDGYEVAQELRSHNGNCVALLIAMTGYGQDKDKELAKAAGFDMHLIKPVDLDSLQDLLVQFSAKSLAGKQ
ncbi:MAG: ATP-binding protein [Gemmataceae bacterium]